MFFHYSGPHLVQVLHYVWLRSSSWEGGKKSNLLE